MGCLLSACVVAAQPRTGASYGPAVPARARANAASASLQTIENGRIRVGVDTKYGGALTYLAFLNDQGGLVRTDNMVNNPDLGRQVQIALYGGPLDYSRNGASAWAGLGWNPIQAGDTWGNASEVLEIRKESNLLYVKTIPKQFAINNEPGQATIEHWIRLDGNVVKVHARAVLFRSDKTQYEARQQEMPCVYLNGDYHNMYYYKGGSPFTNGPLERLRPQPPQAFPFGDVFPTEPWMASVNDNGYGVGLYIKDNYDWKKGYFGRDLSGGEFNGDASYIAATNFVVLDHNITHEWDYELVVGHLNEIRTYINAQPRPVPGPNYRFDTSRKGWYYYRTQDTGWPINGKLHILLNDAANNQIKSPFVFWKGRDVPKFYIRAAFRNQNSKNIDDRLRLTWRRPEDVTIYRTEDRYTDFPIRNDGLVHTYEIDLSRNENWMNYNIGQIELRPIPDGAPVNGTLDIEWIATSASGPATETTKPTGLPAVVGIAVAPSVANPAAGADCKLACVVFRVKKTHSR